MKWRMVPGLLVIALFLSLSPVVSQAQDYLTPRFSSFDPGHLSGTALSDDLDGDSLPYREDTAPWHIAGDMRITPFVSMELNYRHFAHPGEGVVSEHNAWGLSGLLSLPLDSGLAPYARLGQMFWASELSPDNLSYANGSRDLYYGVGLRYGLAEQLDLHFEYERFSQNESDYGMSSMNLQLSF